MYLQGVTEPITYGRALTLL